MQHLLLNEFIDGQARHEKRVELDEGLRPQCAFAQFAHDSAVDVLVVVVDEWVAKFEDVHRTGMKELCKYDASVCLDYSGATKLITQPLN